MENKQGQLLRNYLKGSGKKMSFYHDLLKMTSQNFNHHLRKSVLDKDFQDLLERKLGIRVADIFKIENVASTASKGHKGDQSVNASSNSDIDNWKEKYYAHLEVSQDALLQALRETTEAHKGVVAAEREAKEVYKRIADLERELRMKSAAIGSDVNNRLVDLETSLAATQDVFAEVVAPLIPAPGRTTDSLHAALGTRWAELSRKRSLQLTGIQNDANRKGT